jgi:hypothetical protein
MSLTMGPGTSLVSNGRIAEEWPGRPADDATEEG